MSETKWYQDVTPYQWRVLICACLGWALDIMDGYLYAIILFPAMSELLATTENAIIGWYGGIVLSIFMIGWALGGLIFGPIADRYGRARTMALTILIYATFTGLSGIAGSWGELAFYRFVTGLGIGGEWAAGAALIAESWPEKSRTKAAGIMQASGGIGFFLASLLYLFIGPYGWRWVFALGVLPAVVAFYIRRSLDEPDRWVKSKSVKNPFPTLFTGSVRKERLGGHRIGRGGDIRLSRSAPVGAKLDQRYASRPGDKVSDPAGQSHHHSSKRRRYRRLPLFSIRRRPLGQKDRAGVVFLGRPALGADDFPFHRRFHPRAYRVADHGIFRRGCFHRLCDLFSRAVSHRYPRHGTRILFQFRPLLFGRGSLRCRRFDRGSRLFRPRHCDHWINLCSRSRRFDFRAGN